MSDLVDARGCSMRGATPAALQHYESALAALICWRGDSEAALARALREAPRFVMAHVLRAWRLLCSRDPRHVRAARPVRARIAALPANERERAHLAAIGALLDDDYARAKDLLGALLQRYPRDVLALHAAHSFDYVTGDVEHLHERVAAVLPAWSRELPGWPAVLAMQAFGLVENGEVAAAEEAALGALAHDPHDVRAHHVMAHVFENSGRTEAGVRWMEQHRDGWSAHSAHCWWHLALFHLAQRRTAQALALYDERVRAGRPDQVSHLIDASALLWRLQLAGADTNERARELAAAWEPHIDDAWCSFTDLHAMLAFVGARDWARAQRLEQALVRGQTRPTRHGATTRQLGLPAGRALIAFGRGDFTLAITQLASLPALAHRLGGSHAQRDVLHLTLQQAVERVRRPAPRRATGAMAAAIGEAA
jgi:tetratricopeptide (TPR) repeat protein